MIEFWLNQDNEWLQLPVSPSSYSLKVGNNNTVINVESVGELNILGESKLSEISFESFFPAREYYFCAYSDIPTPIECVVQIETWRKSKKPIRVILTDTTINDLFSIETFEYGEKDGTGDIYFTLELKQYKVLKLNEKIVGQWGASFSFINSNNILGGNS
ncbi:hypothetical protein [Clostridium saccharoperbutylacetonicum]|uniref:hypothetical protein n=1 Tax=Clostridium saccharoperbutylacetonicum TaxID=36745 RepID=UPI000983FF8E|nr:hypothetical protein [Clostridium saccharoperbutylacetonicum]AQR93500.1 hypothetical protein CLSAP_08060 [Clostridium saccharoperbutylacetonicum]NSB29198.1 hypothetical protein [Clostridium saccharoperbutylacetonicum]